MKSTERASFAPTSDRVVPDARLAGALHEVSNALTVVVGWLADAQLAAETEPGASGDEARVQLRRALAVAYQHACRGYTVARRAIGAQVDDDDGAQGSLELAQDALLGAAHEASERRVRLLFVDATSDGIGSEQTARGDIGYGEVGYGGAIREVGPSGSSVQVPARAMQILMNLLLNALAFSPPGGTVELEHRVCDGYVAFRVSDEGPGVPMNMRERLFISGESQRLGGAGIGLAHSYALAKECGGSLRLVEGARRGACFELRLGLDEPASQVVLAGIPEAPADRGLARARRDSSFPAANGNDDRCSAPPTVPSLAPPSVIPPAARANFAGMRILLLEDDEAVLEMVRFGLTSRGADVVASTNCEHLGELLKERFDVAVLDLSPLGDEPNGMLSLFQAANVPIVLISGSVAPNLGEVALSAWVHKPFALHELYEVLSELDG